MPFSDSKLKGYFARTLRKPSQDSKSIIMYRRIFRIVLSVYQGYRAHEYVKVKAYKRLRFGKIEKVRSYYRCVKGRRRKQQA